ncbi:MAG: superoxide dismutase [Bacteroidetes bacterium]|nr:superoxide dismutase [Bacteroidota bacterium]
MEKNRIKSRREFIKDSGKATLAAGLSTTVLSTLANAGTLQTNFYNKKNIPYTQTPLPYSYTALEPSIDAMTMEIHYTKHAAGYAKNLADACKQENVNTQDTSLESLLSSVSKYSVQLRNNAGGHYNHELFWKIMGPKISASSPSGKLADMIQRDFNSFEAFQSQFADAAKNRFGSGWSWLVYTNDKKLIIGSTPNQDNPLMDISDLKGLPVMGLDVWEHAYYLKYQNKRADYINAWWNILNWNFIGERFEANI